MKSLKSRYNYDPTQPLSKEYQDAEVFNAYYKCFDTQKNQHYLLSHFKSQNKNQVASLFKKFNNIKDKMAQGMSTKYLTQIHDVFLENKDKSLFVVLDFMEGGSIIDYIGKVYTLDWRSTVKVIYGALNGLLQLHKFDIINCFINLENIEIDQNGTPKLSFKCMIYKTIYLSPQFRKDHTKSKQSDLYCLGASLYRLIYGIFPFKTQKTEELIEMVKKGPNLYVDKGQGQFNLTSPKEIRQLLILLLNYDPDTRLKAIQKFQQFSVYLQQTSILNQDLYSKLFKTKYIKVCTLIEEMDEHQYTILQPKQKKLLKLVLYNSTKEDIDKYIKNVITKFAKMPNDMFTKIYEYQIIQETNLVIVHSYSAEGNLLDYRNNLQPNQGFQTKSIQATVDVLTRSVKLLDYPYKYLTNQSVEIKNGSPRIRFPDFHTQRFRHNLKKASTSQIHFIAPQVLAGKQSFKCDSWSIGVIEYWMIFNEMPKFDSKDTLVINKRQKLSKQKLLYLHNVIQKNPNTRLNVLNEQELKNKFKSDQITPLPQILANTNQQQAGRSQNVRQDPSPKKSNVKVIEEKPLQQSQVKKSQKMKRSKKRQSGSGNKDYSILAAENNVSNSKVAQEPIQDINQKSKISMYKNPIVIQSGPPLPPKNANKFDIRMFTDTEEIKSPQKIQTKQRVYEEPAQQTKPLIERLCNMTSQLSSKFATLQKSYTKSVRVSIKCLIAIIFYLFLFYFDFFRTSGSLIGSRYTYEPKMIQLRAFDTDTRPNVNYTLVTKTPAQTNQMFYNQTLKLLRDDYRCVLNDYSVKSNVSQVIKSSGFVAYQVFGFLIALINIAIVCVVIARFDICKACYITNFEEKKYHTLINYAFVNLYIFSLTSFHYLIYGGLYHVMLEPCLGKSTLPGLEFLMKSWITSWVPRFIWVYLGIIIAYTIIVYFLIKPIKNLNKYIYIVMLILYLIGVGLRGIGKGYPAHQNVFGVCGQLLGLIIGICLFFTDLMFACFSKPRTQTSSDNNIDTRSIQQFNRTQQHLFGTPGIQDQLPQKFN